MLRAPLLCLTLLTTLTLPAQVKRTSVPLADTLTRALAQSSLTTPGSQPFHLRLAVSEPANPQSPYHGTLELWWASPTEWRRELTGPDSLRQLIVTHDGQKTEQDTGDYLPLWLRNCQTAILDPVPDAAAWTSTNLTIDQLTMPDGRKSDACVRAKSQVGLGPDSTDAFSVVCFDGNGRLSSVVSPRYSMEFHDLRKFAAKQIPRELADDPEPGTRLLGKITLLENLSDKDRATLFTPLPGNDDRFQTVAVSSSTMARLTTAVQPITWAPVHSGNTRGHLAMYISADSTGRVREAWPLNSDNAGLEDPTRAQVLQWVLKVATAPSGKPLQVDGGLGFTFDTAVKDPLPLLSDAEARSLAIDPVEPVFPSSQLQPGQVVEAEISVNEKGECTGTSFSGTPSAAIGPINAAVSQWRFRPYLLNGKPQYFHAKLRFTVPSP